MPEVDLIPTALIEAAFRRAARNAVEEAATSVHGEAARRAPMAPAPYRDYGAQGGTTGPRGGRYDLQTPGRLRSNMDRSEVKETATGFEAEIFNDMPYAAAQHEGLHFSHTNGEAKFLENPLKEESPRINRRLEKHLKRELAQLGRGGF